MIVFDIAKLGVTSRVPYMKPGNDLAHQESLIAQWLERPTDIQEAMGSIPIPVFPCPMLVKHFIFIIQSLYTSLGAHQARAYPGFHSMKRLGVLLLPPGWDASP